MRNTTRKYKQRHKRKTRAKRGGKLCETSNNAENIYTINPDRKIGSTWYVYDDMIDKDIVIKEIGPIYYASDMEQIKEELFVAKLASDLQVGPKVLYTKICEIPKYKNPISYIVMERIYGDTLENLMNRGDISDADYKKYIDEYTRLLDSLYDNGITLHDRVLRNIMYGYTKSQPIPRIWIIDFGFVDIQSESVNTRDRKYTVRAD